MITKLAPTHVPSLVLCALALSACEPGSLSLGHDDPTDGDTETDTDGDPATEGEVRWSTLRPDATAFDLAVAPDGSFYLLGFLGLHPAGDGHYYDQLWLGKHDADGGLLWELTEPSGVDASVFPVAVTTDPLGNVYFSTVGYDESVDGDNRVRKLDANGNELWSISMPGRASALAGLPEGGVIVGGSQDSLAWVQPVDPDGNLGWSRTFGDPNMRYSEVTAVSVTADGGVAVGGRLGIDPGSSRSQAWAATLERLDGATRWETLVTDAIATDRIHDQGLAADGTLLLAGWGDAPWVKALATNGSEQWTWINDAAPGTYRLAVFPDGGFAVGDGLYLDPEDPNGCWEGPGPCPVAMRISRLEADRSTRWSLYREDCRSADHLRPTADGGLLATATCELDGGGLGVGVFRLEP
ncbi:NHL repeat-containing protein [Paraliomyxa miuraensis]|uniref:hypothetical protein n=1 Tax=Paraliomyxa miuraensis TaxID=376150 RepID=UPI00224CFF0D|nr:hypothetical protein [Paraliomyxa miuraensis]MCX4248088.1 hypothetical protein [Paraliomyxa miuraensis]